MAGRPQLCPKCRKLVGVDDQNCYNCGANLGMHSRLMQGVRRQALSAGEGMPWWRIVLLVNVALYVIGLVVTMRSGVSVTSGGAFGLLSPSSSVQLQLGLQVQSLVLGGDYWRMVTCLFLHGGLLHLGFNMYFLAQLGPTAEQIFGNRGFLLIYMLGGIAGSAVELLLGNPVLGASGSVMALIGALAGLGIIRERTWDNELTREMVKVLLFVTVFGLIVGSVAHGAHIGGFVGGGLTLMLVQGLRERRLFGVLDRLGFATAALVVVSFGLMGMNLSQPTLGELQSYEKCFQKGLKILVAKPSKTGRTKEVSWPCAAALSEQLPGVPKDVLDGLSDLLAAPDTPGAEDRLKALIETHNDFLTHEAKRFGLQP